ncbi:MAG: SDR family oxidoreductase [Syntrophobacteraceae bacterium]
MSRIENRNVLITGGASGLGRLLAIKAAALGGRVVLWDVNEANLDRVGREVRAGGRPVLVRRCDVTNREDVYRAAREVTETFGPVDILINNAGVISGRSFLDCTDDELQRTMDVNIMAHFWTVRAFLPGMVERRSGHIVTMASAAGIVGVSRMVDYCTSKAAAFGFDEALRMEIRQNRWPVKTTVVCPYFINTGMFDGVRTRFAALLPILDENRVADRIIRAVRKNRRRVIMPPMVYSVWLLRLLPVSVFDFVADLMGINVAMKTFKGRSERAGSDEAT